MPDDGECQQAYCNTAQQQCSCFRIAINPDNAERLGVNWKQSFGLDEENGCLNDNNKALLAFRIAAFIIMLGSTLYSFGLSIHEGTAGYWFIYLTDWALIMEVMYLGFALYTFYKVRHSGNCSNYDEKEIPWFAKTTWILFSVALPAAVTVTLLYWALVYDGRVITLENILIHAMNSLVMLADLFIGSQPLLLIHYLYFLLFAVAYLIWSLIHHSADIGNGKGNRYIYGTLDWCKLDSTIVTVVIIFLIGLPLIYKALWGCIFGRDYCCRGKQRILTV